MPLAHSASITELFLDAGGGTTADLLVDQIGSVTCAGSCGGLSFASSITPHGTLGVTGTLGQFTLTTVSGVGRSSLAAPAVLNLTQNEASTGAGTLTVRFSDTGYTNLLSTFNLSVQSNPDHSINASTVTGATLIDAADTLGGGSSFDSFSLSGVDTYVNATPNAIASGSLTAITQLHFSGRGHIQSTFTISNFGPVVRGVPEPMSLSIAGAALLALGIWRRRAH
jgi:hypothetical protein